MISAAVLRSPELRIKHLERIGSVYRCRKDGEVAIDIARDRDIPVKVRVFSGITSGWYSLVPSSLNGLDPLDLLLDLLQEYEANGCRIDRKRVQWYASLLRTVDDWDEHLEGWDGR